jgi:hypothetical protein
MKVISTSELSGAWQLTRLLLAKIETVARSATGNMRGIARWPLQRFVIHPHLDHFQAKLSISFIVDTNFIERPCQF